MEMMNSMMAQQQPTLSIDQLLRAAKLIEQRAIEKLMVVNQPIELLGTQFSVGPSSMGFSTKLGEDYQERLLASKIRSVLAEPGAYAAPNSTGSSRRSSPISVSSAPNSPETSNAGGMLVGQQPMASTSMLDQHPANIRVHSSASTTSSNGCANGRRVSGSRQSRAAHNELEKNRRANLRGHLEALKSVLPPEADSHRDTTLSLLTRARNYIRFLKDQKSSLADKRASLLAEHLRLRELLQQGGSAAQAVTEAAELPAPKPVFLREQPEHVVEAPQQQQQQVVHAEEETPSIAEEAAKQPSLEFLAMHGLLPALPLLYPYSSAGLGHSPAGSPALC